MTCTSHILHQSEKIRNISKLVRNDRAILIRWFSNDARVYAVKGHDVQNFHRQGFESPDGSKAKRSGSIKSSGAAFSSMVSRVEPPAGYAKRKFDAPLTTGIMISNRTSWSHFPKGRFFSSESGLPLHQEIGMPSLSPTMTEGNIARWLKKEGDKVSPGEVLCEVETDKATVEMECMEEGYLAKILRGDGSNAIKVGEVIAITVEEEEDVAKFKDYKPTSAEPAPASPSKEQSAPSQPKEEVAAEPVASKEPKTTLSDSTIVSGGHVFASPLAKKIAEENNVPLSSIKGTGPNGIIVKADIDDYLASRGKEVPAAASKVSSTAVGTIDYVDIPHSQIRKVTASRLLLSKQTIPHYYLTVDTCVDKLMELRTHLNSLQEAYGGKKLSVNDLVIKAAALALRKVPQCNSSWTNDYIRQYHNVNVNVAVQTDNGLYVPVIKDADKKGLSKISEEVKNLAQKARENSLKPEDYEGGTFTVSNLGGPFGIKQFCAIINPPQAGILAVGSAEKRVVPGSGPDQFKFASYMSVTLSCDHRVIDGAIGAEWLKAFKGYIENPESMLL